MNRGSKWTWKKKIHLDQTPRQKARVSKTTFLTTYTWGTNFWRPSELPPEYLIENWPCEHDAAKRARDQMIDEFRVVPIPAYNIQSNLVHPTQYRRTLKDAVVAIRFILKHWAINSESCDTNTADIVNIRVLVPPKEPQTPRRRKIALTDPFDLELDESPTKKSRTGAR